MPLLEDLLLRFRRVWSPPGPVTGQAGVPEEAGTHLDDELRDVTAALDEIEREGQDLVQAAESKAAEIVGAARLESERIVEAARRSAPRVRADNAAACIRDRQQEINVLIATAEDEADDIRMRARSRIRAVVDGVVADIYVRTSSSEGQGAGLMGRG
jgi:cell division septum initiation protein DivIVA